MTTDKNTTIGKKILSINFGIGTISGVEKLQEGGDEYYVVEYGKKNIKNYFPVKENKKSRFISSKKEFDTVLKRLKSETLTKSFSSRKDKQEYFNTILKDCDLNEIISRVIEISALEDLVVNEKDKYNKLLAILDAEAAIIYDLDDSKSKNFISSFLKEKAS